MKTKIFLMVLLLCSILNQGCEKDDSSRVNSEVKNSFSEMYPGATRVDWDIEGSYAVAEFRDENCSKEAWFDHTGIWIFTETDILFENLPEVVKNAFYACDYSGWRVEDVDRIERSGMEILFVIEVEKGDQEYDLYYSPDGTLIKTVADSGHTGYLPVPSPSSVTDFIAQNYPGAKIIEKDFDDGRYEVDIMVDGKHKELVFDNAGNWQHTQTELRKTEVPQDILAVLEASEYASYRIDDIDFFETLSGDFYLFELESGNREVDVKITSDGQMTLYR